MEMGHHGRADHPTDSQGDRYIAGVVHVDDRRSVPNTETDGSHDPDGGRHRCNPRRKRVCHFG